MAFRIWFVPDGTECKKQGFFFFGQEKPNHCSFNGFGVCKGGRRRKFHKPVITMEQEGSQLPPLNLLHHLKGPE